MRKKELERNLLCVRLLQLLEVSKHGMESACPLNVLEQRGKEIGIGQQVLGKGC
jgi:hypothetical protein